MTPLQMSAPLAALIAGTGLAMADVPKVVTDIAPVHSLTAMVMGELGTPDLILPPGASPHGYAMRPSSARALQDATLVFWVGEALTPWLERPLSSLSGEARTVELMGLPEVIRYDFREGADLGHDHGDHPDHGHDDHGHDEHGHDDHGHDDHGHEEHAHEDHGHEERGHGHEHDAHGHDDHGHEDHGHEEHGHDEHAHDDHAHDDHAHDDHGHDDHAHEEHAHEDHGHEDHAHDDHGHGDHGHEGHSHDGLDPHGWLDPENARVWLSGIADALAEADPENAETYRANAEAARAEIEAQSDRIAEQLESLGPIEFLVYHDGYQYFEHRFGLTAAGAVTDSDATAPGAARVAELRDKVSEAGVDCLFTEPQFGDGLAGSIFEESDGHLVEIDPLGSALTPGADLYPQLLDGMAASFVSCKG